jgi:hypothetical protein
VDRRARLINGFFQPSTIFARNIDNTTTDKDALMNLRLLALFGLVALMISPTRLLSEPLSGLVVDESGTPTAGVFVSAANRALGLTVSVITDESGRYTLPDLPLDSLRVHGVGYTPANVNIAGDVPESITLAPAANLMSQLPGASFLDMLPDDETTRQFIIGCTGCHQLDYPIGHNRGWLSETQWTQRAQQMLAWYGPRSGFPIIPERDPAETAAWLVSHLNDDNPVQPTLPQPITGEAAQAIITPCPQAQTRAPLSLGKMAHGGSCLAVYSRLPATSQRQAICSAGPLACTHTASHWMHRGAHGRTAISPLIRYGWRWLIPLRAARRSLPSRPTIPAFRTECQSPTI